ncbi:MAG: hypothetical protein KDJ36_07190 [Hyphomicrobiaceae bacterium]|nr:hypothetical protein [Hyphomicrobiaceae bacterium]
MEWVQVLQGLLGKLLSQINHLMGWQLPVEWSNYIAIAVALPVLALTAYGWLRKKRTTVRRLSGDTLALDEDGAVVVQHIKSDLKKLQSEIRKAAKNNANTDLSPILELLSARIDQTQDLVADEDANDPDSSPELDRHGRIPRRQMVRLVRETILSNLWSGNYFDESIRRRHVFHASFTDAQGERIAVIVRTPYAEFPKDDDLPYGIDVRHGTRTVMRIQWDPTKHDDITIRYVIRGAWEDAILSWNVSQAYVPKVQDIHHIETGAANTAA